MYSPDRAGGPSAAPNPSRPINVPNQRRRQQDPLASSFPPAAIRLPHRTTVKTQKLVLFPQEHTETADFVDFSPPMPVAEETVQSDAERMRKSDRSDLPRVTSYCMGESFNFNDCATYLKNSHGLKPVQYDECLYFYYESQTKERMFGNPSLRAFGSARPLTQSMYANFQSMDLPNDFKPDHTHNALHAERGEVFVFDYGVVVLWNFTEEEEIAFLSHLKPFILNFVRDEDMEVEDFHFQYDYRSILQPRIFNDMITLKSGNPLIKLTISHGLAQSVKLSLFENFMDHTIQGAVPLPKMLAKYGSVKMPRTKIMKIIGNLYKLRMNVNLISNVLDTPEMFWSEPGLEGLYTAIRGYLEISQRANLLNKRADILADLLSMLSDHLHSSEMTYITWIVIILILVAVIVAMGEVVVKVLRVKAGLPDF